MKYIKTAGIVWAVIYFAIGSIFSFTLGGNDFLSGVAVCFALFLLPLPIVILAVWQPRAAAVALISCAAISVTVSIAVGLLSGSAPDFSGLCKFTLFHVPHLVFAAAYSRLVPRVT